MCKYFLISFHMRQYGDGDIEYIMLANFKFRKFDEDITAPPKMIQQDGYCRTMLKSINCLALSKSQTWRTKYWSQMYVGTACLVAD